MPLTAAVLLAACALLTAPRAPLALALTIVAGAVTGSVGPQCAATATEWHGFAAERQAESEATGPVRVRPVGSARCLGEIELYGARRTLEAGEWVRAEGTWQAGRHRWARPAFVAEVLADAPPPASIRDRSAARLAALRAALETRVRELLPSRAPLLLAFLFARRDQLDPALKEGFVRTGTAHLLAISGFHIGVVASVVAALLTLFGFGARTRVTYAALFCWLYVAGLGFPRPAVRATLLLSALATSRHLGRPSAPLGVLSSALLAFLLVDPSGLLTAGTQLTFAATGGILLLRRPLDMAFASLPIIGDRRLRAFRLAAVVSTAATVPTIPFLGWHFGEVSWLSVPATMLLTPLVSMAVTGGVLLLTVAHVLPGLATALAGGLELSLLSVEAVVSFLSALPVPSALITRAGALGLGVGLLAGLTWSRFAGSALSAQARVVLGALLSLIGGTTVPVAAHLAGNGSLEIHMLDVGQGDATLLRSPAGRWLLVDAGPRNERFDAGERRVLPYLRSRGVRRLDRLLLTHADLDHVGGAPAVLAGLPVMEISDPGDARGSTPYLDVLRTARELGVPWRSVRAGARWEFDGVEIVVLGPPDPAEGDGGPPASSNDRSLLLLIRYGAFETLLTGDAPSAAEHRILDRLPLELEVLKVGHHGSTTSTSPELVARTRPRVALISAGRRNRYGHPAPDVVARLEGVGARILRTDVNGSVRVRASDSGSFRVHLDDEPDESVPSIPQS